MRNRLKYPRIILNIMVALAISLVVNFSHLLLILTERSSEGTLQERLIDYPAEGVLTITADGHGYILYGSNAEIDSVYVPMQRIRRMSLESGDRLSAQITPPRRVGGHHVMREITLLNGKRLGRAPFYEQPRRSVDFAIQFVFSLLFSLSLISILTAGSNRADSTTRFIKRSFLCLVVAVALYFVAPVIERPRGDLILNCMSSRHHLDYMLLLKCSFAFVVAILYGRIYGLIYQQQSIIVENEQLKNENLTTRYNMLVSQINPHFFFNSLNSLSMLVREKEEVKALTYIDQLSYTFRYILQNGQNTLTTLADELKFAEAYVYLFKIRFADKLFFDIVPNPDYSDWVLPVLTLQPLLDNVVKHNMITKTNPLHVSIRIEAGYLIVSNPKQPKLEAEASTGIGLENLQNRWILISRQKIEVIDTLNEFTVRMPLQKPVG
ncbi:MAG: histidine kinase [Alistipes sp.]